MANSTHETTMSNEQIAAEFADRYPTAHTVTSDPDFRRLLTSLDRNEPELQCYLLHLQLIDAMRVAEGARRDVRRLFDRLGVAGDDRRLFVAGRRRRPRLDVGGVVVTGERLRRLDELLSEFLRQASPSVRGHVAAVRGAVTDAIEAAEGGRA